MKEFSLGLCSSQSRDERMVNIFSVSGPILLAMDDFFASLRLEANWFAAISFMFWMRSAFDPFPDPDEEVESDFDLDSVVDLLEGDSESFALSELLWLSDLGLLIFAEEWVQLLLGLLLWLLLRLSFFSGSPEWGPLDRFGGRSSP
jgi:hypothetical protein